MEFHNKHDETIKMKNISQAILEAQELKMKRKTILETHKSWLVYQITFLKTSMESIRRLYRFLGKA